MRVPSSLLLAALGLALSVSSLCACTSRREASGAADSGAPSSVDGRASPTASLPDTPAPNDVSVDMKCPDELLFARRGGTDADRYVVPSDDERAALTDALIKLASASPSRAAAEAELAPLGFEVVDVSSVAGAVIVREVDDRRRGGGAYLIRLGSASPLVVQTPHTFFDEGTLPLGCELFARSAARALFVETAHRYKAAEATEDGEHPADVAHQSGSFFQAATLGLLSAGGIHTVVQLHGFSLRKPGEVVVVSSGAKMAGDALVDRAQAALAPVLGEGRVSRYPADTLDLGATTNVQGSLVRSRGARFLHVEMESRLRKELKLSPDYRGRFLLALEGALRSP